MVFSSMLFLWIFLPAVLILYWLFGNRFQNRAGNVILLVASLFFYAWGEPVYIFLLLFSVVLNYVFALLIAKSHPKLFLFLDIVANLLLIGYFKYYAFFATYLNKLLPGDPIPMREIGLPLGISFYTFQAMSYVIDVYRKEVEPQKNFGKVLLYISLFPQLIAGPIVRYKDIAQQIDRRDSTWEKRSYGIRRFLYGLAKKVLFANFFAYYADRIFTLNLIQVGCSLEWLKMLFYTLQIYYDFSGYSDMAIGLGSMFGFDLKENFNYPYISKSAREFWRRWHISLSTWFKEYVYIPLGGSRKGAARTYVNLLIVFFLTGLWHGASMHVVVWGLFYGVLLVIERLFLGKLLDALPKHHLGFLGLIYCWIVTIVGWTFFREESIHDALHTIRTMFSFHDTGISAAQCLTPAIVVMLILGILLSGFLQAAFPKFQAFLYSKETPKIWEVVLLFGLLFLCMMRLVSDSYNAFIYFRF